ncbi:hypothetical protein P7K49_026533 [Saguinus oedipus]|uniref:Secreted protein n=1 Tax=Saguinus oedipus TaxID=9490 RepID=A0ABQ9UDG8_SAGOE|nr:hypothetical protein P7K49_026533 [Saguinus oedipus]
MDLVSRLALCCVSPTLLASFWMSTLTPPSSAVPLAVTLRIGLTVDPSVLEWRHNPAITSSKGWASGWWRKHPFLLVQGEEANEEALLLHLRLVPVARSRDIPCTQAQCPTGFPSYQAMKQSHESLQIMPSHQLNGLRVHTNRVGPSCRPGGRNS